MPRPDDSHALDPVLLPYLAATEETAGRCLAEIMARHAQPLVEAIMRRKFGLWAMHHGAAASAAADVADLQQDVALSLMQALAKVRREPEGHSLADFRGYAARTAYNAWNLYLRQRFPERARLKNRLRYLAQTKKNRQFRTWADAHGETWFAKETKGPDLPASQLSSTQLGDIMREHYPAYAQAHLEDLAQVLLAHADGALRLDDAVAVIAELWQLCDGPPQGWEDAELRLPSAAANAEEQFVWHEQLGKLWSQIQSLRPNQRSALLLAQGPGCDVVQELVWQGIANVTELAAALSVTPEKLAELWPTLPWDDKRIAVWLGLMPQQVSTLRRCARDRLWHNLKDVLLLSH